MSRRTDAEGGGKHSGTGSVGKAPPPLGTDTSDAASPVIIQTVERSVPRVPSWFGEVTVIARYLQRLGVLSALEERVRFARRRFGHYDVIDFVVVLLSYAISGERTLEAFYESMHPYASSFMTLAWRENASLIARRSLAFLLLSIKRRLRHCAPCFLKI
ncbi:MAG TPA: hypothetical protein VFB12_02330 [Ktedonobacteraceae bacterium]|nr:hypothetical protein [Ktedonobacteraceae bacterium]